MNHRTGNAKTTNKTMKKTTIILGIIVIAIFLLLIWILLHSVQQTKQRKKLYITNASGHEIGKIESILDQTEKSYLYVHYPVLEKPGIDKIIKDKVNDIIRVFQQEIFNTSNTLSNDKAELNIDYRSYVLENKYASIVLLVDEYIPNSTGHKKTIFTYVFHLQTEKQLTLKDIFKGNYLDKLSTITYDHIKNSPPYKDHINETILKQNTASNEVNFEKFFLRKNKLTIVFDSSNLVDNEQKAIYVSIPYQTIEDILNIDIKMNVSKNQKKEIVIPSPNTPARIIDPNKPMIALTFDDGPHGVYTDKILNSLASHYGAATFFMLGNRIINYPAIVKRVVEQGSEIGNHSWNHKQLTSLSINELRKQIEDTNQIIYQKCGIVPRLLRPTYGSINDMVKLHSLMPLILWNVDTQDWRSKNPDLIYQQAMEGAKDGNIILMHDIYRTTAEAADKIITELSNRGFQLVTISEMFQAKNIALENGKRYFSLYNVK